MDNEAPQRISWRGLEISRRTESVRIAEIEMLMPTIRDALGNGALDVLEIGCGRGVQTAILQRLGRVWAIDPFETLSPRKNAFVARARSEHLPFRERSYDLVFSSSVLEHIEDLPRALHAMTAVLRPAGIMVHCVPGPLWKALAVGAHYARLLSRAIRLGQRTKISSAPSEQRTREWRGREGKNLRPMSRWLPTVHGTAASNIAELLEFRAAHWRAVFSAAGLQIACMVPQYLYSPPEFALLSPIRMPAWTGLASCYAFFLRPVGGATDDRASCHLWS